MGVPDDCCIFYCRSKQEHVKQFFGLTMATFHISTEKCSGAVVHVTDIDNMLVSSKVLMDRYF